MLEPFDKYGRMDVDAFMDSAITHTFHVLLRDVPELSVGQSVFRRRVQRDLENRIQPRKTG